MHCPKCGIEVTEQSVYCHRCGERIDLADRPFASSDPAEAEPDSAARSGQGPAGAPVEPTPTAAERLQQAAAARPAPEHEPEQELWQGRYSSKAMLGGWVLSGLISIAVLFIWIRVGWVGSHWVWMLVLIILPWLVSFLVLKYRQWSVRYRLTTQRFVHETGIVRRVTDRIEVIDMDDITFRQGLLERLVGVGTIHISSSDKTHPELLLAGIEKVKQVAEKIDDTRRNERRRRAVHWEQI